MQTITRMSRTLQSLFGAQADQLARETGLVQREVKVTGSKFAQTLVFGFLDNPKMSYRQMSQAGALSGLNITAQGLEQKFSAASANFMQCLLEQALQPLMELMLSVIVPRPYVIIPIVHQSRYLASGFARK